jgi:hypothetical protein
VEDPFPRGQVSGGYADMNGFIRQSAVYVAPDGGLFVAK